MRKISITLLLIIFLAVPVLGGDPVDSNDQPSRALMDADAECARAEAFTHCGWCWNNCMIAILAESWNDGRWEW